MGQAFSSVKQNQQTEKTTRTIAAAEMGISYYQVAIQEYYESKQSVVNSHVSAIMSQPNAATTKDFKRESTLKMAEELQKMIPIGTTIPAIPVDGHPNAKFTIKNFVAAADPTTTGVNAYKINISFNIVGTEDGKDTTLLAEMFIDLDSILNLPTTNDPNYYFLPNYNNINDPKVTPCNDLSSCKPVYITDPAKSTIDGNNLLSDNLVIYSKEGLTFTGQGNENNNNNIKIHAEKDILVGQNMISQTKMTIETNGNATFQQNLKIDTDSTLLAKQNLRVNQQLDISKQSFVYVGENAYINKLFISSNKMCVNGNLYIDSSKSGDTVDNLIVKGKIYILESGVYKEIPGGNVNSDTFKTKCGTYVPPQFQINWGDKVTPVISDVAY
jgi:hypothetical protein